jgi:hypothetical protein
MLIQRNPCGIGALTMTETYRYFRKVTALYALLALGLIYTTNASAQSCSIGTIGLDISPSDLFIDSEPGACRSGCEKKAFDFLCPKKY